MKRILFATVLLFSWGCEQKDIPMADHPGAQIYHGITRSDVRCYRCHGPIGEGSSRAPALVKEGAILPRAIFVKTVLEGKNRMPPFASVLTESEIISIMDWLEAVNRPSDGKG